MVELCAWCVVVSFGLDEFGSMPRKEAEVAQPRDTKMWGAGMEERHLPMFVLCPFLRHCVRAKLHLSSELSLNMRNGLMQPNKRNSRVWIMRSLPTNRISLSPALVPRLPGRGLLSPLGPTRDNVGRYK